MSQKIRQDISLGDKIRTLRKKRNLTQEQLVAKMQLLGFDMSRSIYSQIECGSYNIRVSELLAIARILKCDMNTLFDL